MWLVTTTSVIVMLLNGVQGTNRFTVIRHTLHALYVVVLFWYLARTGPSYNQLPVLNPQVLPRWKIAAWLPAIGIALIFWLNLVSDDGIADSIEKFFGR